METKYRRSCRFMFDENTDMAISEFINSGTYSSFSALAHDAICVLFEVKLSDNNPHRLDGAHKNLIRRIIEQKRDDKRE